MVLGTMEAQKWTLRFLLSIKEETTLGRTHTGITLDTTFACLLEQCTFSYPVSVSNVNASSLEGVCVCIRINHQWWNSEQKKTRFSRLREGDSVGGPPASTPMYPHRFTNAPFAHIPLSCNKLRAFDA